MTNSESVLVENLLSRPEMHRQWARDYRTDDNERFYEQAFDFIVDRLKPGPGATFLDAGCGSCAHSVRLARPAQLPSGPAPTTMPTDDLHVDGS